MKAVRLSPATDPAQLAQLWEEVSAIVPGTLITQDEAGAYVAGTMSDGPLQAIERLLEETPEFARKLRALREEFAASYTAEKRAEAERRIHLGERRSRQSVPSS